MDKQRKKFERWAKINHLSLALDENCDYLFHEVRIAWAAWNGSEESNQKTENALVSKIDVESVFNYWLCRMRKGATCKLTSERKRLISARIKDGYSIEDIKKAIDNCSLSGFHMGDNDSAKQYNDLTLICRNGSKLEQFRDMTPVNRVKIKERPVMDSLNDRSWAIGSQRPGIEDLGD